MNTARWVLPLVMSVALLFAWGCGQDQQKTQQLEQDKAALEQENATLKQENENLSAELALAKSSLESPCTALCTLKKRTFLSGFGFLYSSQSIAR